MRKKAFWDWTPSMSRPADFPAFIRSAGHFRLYEPHRQSWKEKASFCELFWCIEGRGSFQFGGKRYLLRPGEVWYYPEGSRHCFGPAAGSFFHYRWFTIEGKQAASLFQCAGIPPGMSYGGPCPEELFAQLELLIRQSTREKRLRQLAVGFEILCRAGSGVKRRKRSSDNYAEEALGMIDYEFSNPELNIQAIAEILHVNRVQLSREFSRQYGVSISAYLRNLRMQKGMELLRKTSLPIAEIAASCGYASADYFSKVIAEATGESPSFHRPKELSCGKNRGNSKRKRFSAH